MKVSKHKYNDLLKEIRQLVEQARHNVIRNINTELLLTYWNVGRLIVAKGQIIKNETDIAKDPYVLEFLNIPEHYSYTEKHLEQKIIDNLQKFILELGKGFAFIARQFRKTLNNKHYRVDVVFYYRILKCFVLIDLKIKSVEHSDIGQMNLYLNYFETEQSVVGDNQPIGIILSKHKDDITV